jgi:hypothetical protein
LLFAVGSIARASQKQDLTPTQLPETQRRQRIDPRRAPRRDVARGETDGAEHRADDGERRRIARVEAEQERLVEVATSALPMPITMPAAITAASR